MGGLQQMVIVTGFIFITGLVFHAGRLSARVDHLEREFDKQRVEITTQIATLTAMVRAAIAERRHWREEVP